MVLIAVGQFGLIRGRGTVSLPSIAAVIINNGSSQRRARRLLIPISRICSPSRLRGIRNALCSRCI